ncbi:MAG TPA: LytTR family DNA-binding domain-containing protein [Bacteroidales bacterium]|nr:LytTR family DNA-binding domain-containing protein [Bacteroidales bacterium]HNS46785.1 LytTR family DNA-binding domain-containing protein [Bacteroidales bacterium]
MRTLIVEDEPYARKELIRLLEETGRSMDIVASLDSVEDSVEWLQMNPMPDLIFMDIQLADGLSFEIFRKVDITVPVIFTTAFDQYAIQAFKVNSVDYLLKPIKPDELERALLKLEQVSKQYSTSVKSMVSIDIEKLLKNFRPDYKSRFMIRLGDQYKHVDATNIGYFKAEDNEVMLVTRENRTYIIDHSLDELSQVLDPLEFFRVSRRYIVNIHAVVKVSKYFNSRLVIDLVPEAGEKVLVSRVKVQEFLKWMDK